MWSKIYNNMTLQQYLDECNKLDLPDSVKQYNKELLKDYPFLIPKNVFTGKTWEDYDYSYTCLDDLPRGWRIAFGQDLLDDLKQELEKSNFMKDYQILQIKEKFGGLRWYDNGCTTDWNRTILPKYETMSYVTCITCGQPAKYETKGWIVPLCETCAQQQFETAKQYCDSLVFENYVTKLEDL